MYDYSQDPRYLAILDAVGKTGCQGHPRFYQLLATEACLHADKNHDYAGEDPLANLKGSEEDGIPGYVGTWVRMRDKISRFRNWIKGRITNSGFQFKVKDEPPTDTLLDMSVYAKLEIILIEETARD